MAITAGDLARLVDGELVGDATRSIRDAQALDKAGPDELTFVADEANAAKLKSCRAGAVLIPVALFDRLPALALPPAAILVDDPYAAFVRALETLRPQRPRRELGVSPQAIVAETATIGPGTNVFPGAWIGEDVVIGAGCDVHPGVVVGDGCRLGDGVTLHPHVVLYPGLTVGNRVIVHASSVLGADGFGYRFRDGRHAKLPHFGTVRIDDDVEIGACTTIDRAMIGATTIGAGTKLDNHVMVAHNCEMGRHNIMVAQSGLAGSVTTGDYVVCGGHVAVGDHLHLGTGCRIGSTSAVHKDVPDGETHAGTPAQPAAEAMRCAMALKKLPEMRTQFKRLLDQVAALESRIDELTSAQSQREAA